MSISKTSSVKFNIARTQNRATAKNQDIAEVDVTAKDSKLDRDFSNSLLYAQNKQKDKEDFDKKLDKSKKRQDSDKNEQKNDSTVNKDGITDFYA